MKELKFIGRGSAFNVKEGNTSAYLKSNGHLMLFDCGENIFERILKLKLLDDVASVRVYISHLNSDHVGSLSSLIYYCFYVKKIKVKVFFPKIQELIDLLSLNGNKLSDYELIENESIYIVPTKHIEGMNCYGYVIPISKTEYHYFSGDSNVIPNVILEDLKDGLITRIYQDTCLSDYKGNVHLSLKKLKELIPLEYRHKVYCMHLDCEELINEAKDSGFNVVEVEL